MGRQQKQVQLFGNDPQSFVNNLNVFYSQFDTFVGTANKNILTEFKPMRIEVGEVTKVLCRIKPNKSTSPDGL